MCTLRVGERVLHISDGECLGDPLGNQWWGGHPLQAASNTHGLIELLQTALITQDLFPLFVCLFAFELSAALGIATSPGKVSSHTQGTGLNPVTPKINEGETERFVAVVLF